MRIVHVSDAHGQLWKLPAADLYIFTGDVYPNFPMVERMKILDSHMTVRRIVPDIERVEQWEWAMATDWRPFFGNPDAPVVTVGGNHDFIETAPIFRGGDIHEIIEPTDTFDILGLKIGGFRGITYIAGEWNDELDQPTFYDVVKKVPKDLDVIVSHSPPLGILDRTFGGRYGSQPFRAHLTSLEYEPGAKVPRLCCFGHIHVREMEQIGETIFSNAATGHNVIDI